MAQKFLTNIDLNKNELQNAKIQNLGTAPTSPADGQIYFDTGDNALKIYDGSSWVNLQEGDISGVTAGTGLSGGGTSGTVTLNLANTSVSAGSYGSATAIPTFTVDAQGRLTAVSTASISTNLSFTDDNTTSASVALNGGTLSILGGTGVTTTANDSSDSLTVAIGQAVGTTADVTFNSVTVSGNLTVSGTTTTVNTETITLADNVILINSNATGSASEDGGIEIERGDDSNVTLLWDETNNRWTVGSESFVAGSFIGDLTGTILTASQTNITAIGTIATGEWQATDIAVAHGGTGASTAAGAKTNLGFMTRYAATIGNNSDTAIAVTHSLGTEDVVVEVYDATTKETVICDVDRTSTNAVTLTFSTAPDTNAIRVVIIG